MGYLRAVPSFQGKGLEEVDIGEKHDLQVRLGRQDKFGPVNLIELKYPLIIMDYRIEKE